MSKARNAVSVIASLLLIGTGCAGIWYAWQTLERIDHLDAKAERRAQGRYRLHEEMHFPGYDFSIQTAETAHIVTNGKDELRAPQGRQFLVVTAEITNTGKAPLTFTWLSAVQLIDGDGVAHDHDTAASQAYADHVAKAGLSTYGYGKTLVIAPVDHKAVGLIYAVPEWQFDRKTWQIALRGQDVRISLELPPPDPNAPIYDPVV